MTDPDRQAHDGYWKWGYWIVFALLAAGAAHALIRLARAWGWI